MPPVLEAVPNFSEGRDLELVRRLVDVMAREGADVLDWSADPDHNRSVVTLLGDPATVEAATLAAARVARDAIDLTRHSGVHPRIGALDVLPLVPLAGLSTADAVASARRVGAGLVDLGLPVYWYGSAAPPDDGPRTLARLRRGGFEALRDGFPDGRKPDLAPAGMDAPHPTAGVTCVGVRRLLLAWNVYVQGVALAELKALASEIRERDGGFRSLRALAFQLPRQGRMQISMNLEDLEATSPFLVFRAVEERVEELEGRITGTEVIGMIPDALVLPAAEDRLQLLDSRRSRLLSSRLAKHLGVRSRGAAVRPAKPGAEGVGVDEQDPTTLDTGVSDS